MYGSWLHEIVEPFHGHLGLARSGKNAGLAPPLILFNFVEWIESGWVFEHGGEFVLDIARKL